MEDLVQEPHQENGDTSQQAGVFLKCALMFTQEVYVFFVHLAPYSGSLIWRPTQDHWFGTLLSIIAPYSGSLLIWPFNPIQERRVQEPGSACHHIQPSWLEACRWHVWGAVPLPPTCRERWEINSILEWLLVHLLVEFLSTTEGPSSL